jgi:AcrR family transcriptional regulator
MRDLAVGVGVKAPTLYAYFASKSDIYDALFRQGWEEFDLEVERLLTQQARDDTPPRESLRQSAHLTAEFAVVDPARYQLMFQRVIPDFEPSPESYEAAVRVLDRLVEALAHAGVDDPAAVDLWTAVITGLTDQQISNDPGGDRWLRLIDRACEMLCDNFGIPSEATAR